MWKRITICGVFGFVIAGFWMCLGLLMFNEPNGKIADLYYTTGKLVCPIFPVSSSHDLYGPPINAFLYAIVAWIILTAIGLLRSTRSET